MFVITGPNNGKDDVRQDGGPDTTDEPEGPLRHRGVCGGELRGCIYAHFVTPDDITKGEGRYRNELIR